ncbi:homer protein homolog 1b isoform X1 [Pangasianodon hypophthalmus]|uniref:homer protein homolog 1b isoform X1 n=1 Tax=Pangasianodon hypophthalmus TaxID=310915 RepID=UPI002307CA20|nr:homer protein homolog 1b isoform X1 [Pangasianodon hypophthalmus]
MEAKEMVLQLPGRASSPSGFGQTTVLRHKEVHHFFFVPFREQPIYSTRAHVFQIDPNTKKNWMPTSKHAVTVSYFYDSTRNVYRIISLDGSKAIINSTITPNMSFTKTSQKFGQWADSRANTVYGLGFSSEHHLSKFADKFAEYKEAARLAKEKSLEKMELASSPSQESPADIHSPLTPPVSSDLCRVNGTGDDVTLSDASPNSELQSDLSPTTPTLAHSPTTTKHWEAELAALKSNNAKLTAALLESTANVKQWKQQLAAYQEEAERLHKRVSELESQSSQANAIKCQKTELNKTIEELEATLKAKEEEMDRLREEVEKAKQLQSQKETLEQKLEATDARNKDLEEQLADVEQRLETSQLEQENFRKSLKTLLEILDSKIFELTEMRDNLAKLIEDS